QRGRAGRAGEVIKALALGRPEALVKLARAARCQCCAARLESSELRGAVLHRGRVVIGRVAQRLQAAFHHAALGSETWLLSISVSSRRTRLNSGSVMQRGRSSGMR